MGVERGRAWGENGPLPDDGVVARSDAEARAVVTTARRANEQPPPIGLLAGDLCRTLGGTGDEERLHTPEATRVTVDLGSVLVDGRLHWFVAHLIARKSWWRGRALGAMNAQFLDGWDVAPRAHPGDGLLDVLDVAAELSLMDRITARGRLPAGSHLPHPAIAYRRVGAIQADLAPPLRVWLDGEALPDLAHHLAIRVEPDALRVVV